MKILFMHNNFPGQYRRIARYLQTDSKVEMLAATLSSNQQDVGVKRVNFKLHRDVTPKIHPLVAPTERAVLNAQAAFSQLYALKREGWTPDLVCAHSGWGPSLLIKELWPTTKLLCLFEWYYQARGSDADFLEPISHDAAARAHFKNVPILLDYATMDWGQSPTEWQVSQFPEHLRPNLSVQHEGVDCSFFTPGDDSVTAAGRVFTKDDEVITYVARGMEPYRGFPQFMEAVSLLQQRRPNLHVLIAGQDRVAYGKARPDKKTYREHALETLDLDTSRIHFLGLVPLSTLRAMFRITKAHVYLTVPFVLSWSMLEAMAAGALVVGSDTAPVREVITDQENGLLVDFFSSEKIAECIESVLARSVDSVSLETAARTTIANRYDLPVVLPRQLAIMDAVAKGGDVRAVT